MKKILKCFFLASFALMLSACGSSEGKSGGDDPSQLGGDFVPGEWKVTSWNDEDGFQGKVYIQFNKDKTYELYQLIQNITYEKFQGTYLLKAKGELLISGVYKTKGHKSEPWAEEYVLKMTESQMTMIGKTSKAKAVYHREPIPQEVKENYITRGEGAQSVQPFL